MIKAYTSLLQSEALVKAGLDPRTSDMWFDDSKEAHFGKCGKRTPCWSMARLMALLPEEITIDIESRNRKHFRLSVEKFEPFYYDVAYYRNNYITGEIETLKESSSYDSPLDAIYEVLVWVLQNDYEDNDIYNEIMKD